MQALVDVSYDDRFFPEMQRLLDGAVDAAGAKVNAPPSHGKVMGSGGHSSPMPLVNNPQLPIAEVTEPNQVRLLPQTTVSL